MNTLKQTEDNEKGIFALIKGPSGSGKSVLGLSFPNLFVFDYDFKMPAIAQKHFPKKSIDWQTFTDTDQISDLLCSWLVCPKCGTAQTCSTCGTSCPYES